MKPIPNADRSTVAYFHALGAYVAATAGKDAILLDLDGVNEPSPAAQRVAVADKLAEAMGGVERMLRAKRAPITETPRATLGRELVQEGEVFDAVAKTYSPGPGFEALIVGAAVDGLAAVENAGE
ncbi:MAG: hypothetical protein H6523_13325 [Mycolicibacterium sp.]|nr:hypothetical protein [Mycolicibacterium sp.]